MPNSPVFTLRLPEALSRDLERRASYLGGNAGVVRTDLGRYRTLVRGAQTRLAIEGVFTTDEGAAIIDALNGTLLVDRPEALTASVEDAMRLDGLAEKWEVDAAALTEKLRGLTALELHAVADAVERFWSAPEERDIGRGLFGESAT
jgi:hypothetical protein